jgi:hypothetical protein
LPLRLFGCEGRKNRSPLGLFRLGGNLEIHRIRG